MKVAKKVIAIVLAVVIVAGGLVIGLTKKDQTNYFFSAMHNAVAAINDGSWQDAGKTPAGAEAGGGTSLTFTPDTYGGVEFKTVEDVVNYYAKAYEIAKTKTASYIDGDGNKQTYYAFLGNEDLNITSVLVEGKENAMITKLVPGIVGGLFKKNIYGLPPCANKDPEYDNDENEDPLKTLRLTAEDVKGCEVKDNGDGTITITIIPQDTDMSHKGLDAQGHVFNTLGAIDNTVDSISVLSWAEGTTADNCKVMYKDGTATVKIDTKSGEIVEADYKMLVEVQVNHANVTVIKNKSAGITIEYTQHFPATDDEMMKDRQIKRA